ncbi:MAG: hypothetical protein GX987_05155 [Tissierellia bacterium]|nr:hypothetical protein [Tissierellia bacterium]
MSKEKQNDLTLKIFALIIAIILWSYVMSEVNPKRTEEFKVDVNFSNVASLERQGLVILEPKDVSIKVTVSGRTSDVIKISEEDIIAKVDLSGYKEGNVKVPVYVDAPYMVEVVDYTPKEILFKFDKLVRRDSPVTVKTTGELPKGYTLGEPEVKPQSVYIEGPRSWVSSVSEVVALVNITDITEDINATVPIKLVDDEGNDVRGVEKEQNVVDIFIPIYQTKKVPIELQTEGQLPDNYEILDISIKPSTIEIKGKKENLIGINSIKTKPIDINELIDNKNVVLDLEVPENVGLTNPNQKVTITLNIDENKTKTFQYNLRDVNIRNLDPELNVDENELNKSFEVTVGGSSSKIDLLNKENLTIELDLFGLKEGTHTVNLLGKGEEGITIMKIEPESFNIILKSKE